MRSVKTKDRMQTIGRPGSTIRALSLALGVWLAGASAGTAQVEDGPLDAAEWTGPSAEAIADLPPLSQEPDSAEILYRDARAALARGEVERSVELFRALRADHPESRLADDALYWEAFGLYRLATRDPSANESQLRDALGLLEMHVERRMSRGERFHSDVQALLTRIQGQLARRGDPQAAQALDSELRRVAEARASEERAARQHQGESERLRELERRVAAEHIEAERQAQSQSVFHRRVPEGCDAGEIDVRLAALNALVDVDPDQARDLLRTVLAQRELCSRPLREMAPLLLSRVGGPGTAEYLLSEVARNDPSPQVRIAAVAAASRMDPASLLPQLEQLALTSEDPELAQIAIQGIGRIEAPETRDLLLRIVADPALEVRRRATAAYELRVVPDGTTAERLRAAFTSTDEPELQEAILASLARVASGARTNERSSTALSRWLSAQALDESLPQRIRRQAAFHAVQMGLDADDLLGLYMRSTDREVRGIVILSMAERDEARVLDELIEIARSGDDPQLRSMAVQALARSDSPRAAAALAEIAGGGGG